MRATGHEHIESYRDGDVVVREGETSCEMFVIQHGRVDVSKRVDGGEVLLATLERGSFFGEMALLDSQPRSATVRARGDTRLLVIEPGALLIKIRRDPTFAFEMLQHLGARIRDLDERLVHLIERQSGREDAAITAATAEYAPRASTTRMELRP